MGICQSFARVSADDLTRLRSQPEEDTALALLAEQRQRGLMFTPLHEDSEDAGSTYSLILEEGYWEQIDRVMKIPANEEIPPIMWPFAEDRPKIGDFWMGYSPLLVVSPEGVKDLARSIPAFTRTRLLPRFRADWQAYDDVREEELQDYFERMMFCLEDLLRFVQVAAQAGEAIVWYVGSC